MLAQKITQGSAKALKGCLSRARAGGYDIPARLQQLHFISEDFAYSALNPITHNRVADLFADGDANLQLS